MASNRFIDLIKGTAAQIAARAKEAIDWFKDTVSDVQKKQQRADPNNIFKVVSSPQIGSMYLFTYDAKYKATLPFFDMHPLVFPIEMYSDGFLGLNLHYLPPLARVRLLKALDDTKNNNKYNETTKLNISYGLLRAYSNQFRGNEQCIKRYLFGHVRSQFHLVHPSDWEKVVMLPLQRWSVNPNKRYTGNPPY